MKSDQYDELDVKTISLKIPEPLLAELEAFARARKTGRSAVIRAAIAEHVSRKRYPRGSVADLARDIIGSVEGLPPDLSTNPKYMRGFGK